jgi:hypothetical protein
MEDILAFMHFESAGTMSPAITNSLGFTGLIQFGRQACAAMSKKYNTTITTDMLRRMSRSDQMDWVEKYFDMWISIKGVKSPIDSGKLYMIVALPAYVNAPDDQVLYGPGSNVWNANPGWRDPPKSGGPITPRGVKRGPKQHLPTVTALLSRGGATATA